MFNLVTMSILTNSLKIFSDLQTNITQKKYRKVAAFKHICLKFK